MIGRQQRNNYGQRLSLVFTMTQPATNACHCLQDYMTDL